MFSYDCPLCGTKLQIPDEYAGKQGRCKNCGGNFLAAPETGPAGTGQETQNPVPPVSRSKGYDERVADAILHFWGRSSGHHKAIVVAGAATLVVLIALGLVAVRHSRRTSGDPYEQAQAVGTPSMAYVMSQDFAKERFNLPDSAVFSAEDYTSEHLGMGKYKVRGQFAEAQGQPLMAYTCTMVFKGRGQWTCRDLELVEDSSEKT